MHPSRYQSKLIDGLTKGERGKVTFNYSPSSRKQASKLIAQHAATCGSSRGPTSATLSSTPGTVLPRLQITETWTERLRCSLHVETIGSTMKTSRKEKKLVKDNRQGNSLVILLVSLSSRPRRNSNLLAFHEAQAWSPAALHALYHISDKTRPFTQSLKKGHWGIWQAYLEHLLR